LKRVLTTIRNWCWKYSYACQHSLHTT